VGDQRQRRAIEQIAARGAAYLDQTDVDGDEQGGGPIGVNRESVALDERLEANPHRAREIIDR
jgi:hypothetical protein